MLQHKNRSHTYSVIALKDYCQLPAAADTHTEPDNKNEDQ
jgi:hypothetical protein